MHVQGEIYLKSITIKRNPIVSQVFENSKFIYLKLCKKQLLKWSNTTWLFVIFTNWTRVLVHVSFVCRFYQHTMKLLLFLINIIWQTFIVAIKTDGKTFGYILKIRFWVLLLEYNLETKMMRPINVCEVLHGC